jgi:hypothetical protein
MTVPIMAHSNLKLKTYITGSRTSHLDVHSPMEHAQPSYAQITVPNVTHNLVKLEPKFYAQILHQFTVSSNKLLVYYTQIRSQVYSNKLLIYYTKIRSQVYHLGHIAYILDMIQSISQVMYCLNSTQPLHKC